MKKVILIVTMVSVSVVSAFSQFQTRLSLGMSATDFSKEASGTTKAKAGVQLGGTFAYGDKFYVEPGLFYTVKSTEFTYSTDDKTKELNQDMIVKGLRIPISVGYYLIGNSESFIGLRAYGGASGFIALNTGSGIDKKDLNNPGWATHLGASLDIWKLFVDAQYEWSLNDFMKEKSLDLGQHRSLYVNAGVKINF